MKMKKTYFIGIIFFCMFSFHAKSQSSVGAKVDMNLSNFAVKTTHLKSSINVGGSAGLFYKYTRHNRAIETDVMFRYLTSKFKNLDTGETADYRYIGIALPVYFLMQADIDNQSLYLGMGPFASYGMSGYYKSNNQRIDLYSENPINGKAKMRRWDFGAGFITGYELKCRLQFNLNFQIGFRNMIKNGFESDELMSVLLGLGVGYRF